MLHFILTALDRDYKRGYSILHTVSTRGNVPSLRV